MKSFTKFGSIILLLCVFCIFILSGCGEEKSGNTLDEPEITGEYLSEEYSRQLLTDGAETITGFVDMEKSDGVYKVKVTEKEVVPNSSYDEGYYIADTNLIKNLSLGIEPKIACLSDGELIVQTPDEFIKYSKKHPNQLYTIYMMGVSAELIIATSPEDVIME